MAHADFDIDFMDICLRRIKQMDDTLYYAHSESRWRHIMESDFLASMLAGKKLAQFPPVRHQFTGTHISYDIPACKSIFLPWCCQSKMGLLCAGPHCKRNSSIRSSYK